MGDERGAKEEGELMTRREGGRKPRSSVLGSCKVCPEVSAMRTVISTQTNSHSGLRMNRDHCSRQ